MESEFFHSRIFGMDNGFAYVSMQPYQMKTRSVFIFCKREYEHNAEVSKWKHPNTHTGSSSSPFQGFFSAFLLYSTALHGEFQQQKTTPHTHFFVIHLKVGRNLMAQRKKRKLKNKFIKIMWMYENAQRFENKISYRIVSSAETDESDHLSKRK